MTSIAPAPSGHAPRASASSRSSSRDRRGELADGPQAAQAERLGARRWLRQEIEPVRVGPPGGACEFGVSRARAPAPSASSSDGQVKREGAEAHAERLQRPPLVAAERLDARIGRAAVERAELLDELVGEAARKSPQPPVLDRLLEMLERVEAPRGLGGGESLQTPRRALALRLGAEFADQPHARRERLAADDLARRLAPPVDEAAGREREGFVAFAREVAEPARDLGRDDPLDGAAQARDSRAPSRRARARNGSRRAGRPRWPSTVTAPSSSMPPQDGAGALIEAAQKRARAPVDEALHQRLVQRVGKPVLEARAPGPARSAGSASQSARLAT